MRMLFAGSAAVLAYCLVFIALSYVFAGRIKLEGRLGAIADTDEDEAHGEAFWGERLLKSTVGFLVGIVAAVLPSNAAAQERQEEQLRQAGIRMSAREYNASLLLLTICCVIGLPVLGNLLRPPIGILLLLAVIGLYGAIVIARFHLKSRITRRQNEIYHQLPETMDLLSVSVSAGLGFDQALAYVVQKSEGALIRELEIAQRQITLGRPRKEALEQLAKRCSSLELKTFTSAVLQADEVGASIQNVLQIQAATIRETHRQNVEEQANKLSVKMLIPLVFLIFPVLLIVLLGPAVYSIVQELGGA